MDNKSKVEFGTKKIAFFVEGQTEQIFIVKLVKEIFGHNKISIIIKRFVGGSNIPKQEIVRSASMSRNPDYLFLIYDCGSDNRVKSEILDNIENLRENNYIHIIGIRDLYPLPMQDLFRLEKGLKFLPHNYRKYHNPYDIIVAVREIETWFLADTSHLLRVDKRLTGTFIKKYLGFDPYAINAMEREHPSKDLNDIYQLVGRSYAKRYWQVEKLVNRLNFDYLFRHVAYNIPSFGKLVNYLQKIKDNKNNKS